MNNRRMNNRRMNNRRMNIRRMNIRFLHQKLRAAGKQIPYLPRAVGLIWRAAPRLALAWLVLLLLQGLLPTANIYLTRLLVNELLRVIQRGPIQGGVVWSELSPALLLAGGIGMLLLLGQVLQSASSWIHTAQTEKVGLHISSLIQMKASQADYSLFEASEKNDALYRARLEVAYRPVAVLDSLGMLAQGSVTLAAMLALLLPYGAWPILVLFASSLPLLSVVVYYKQRQHAWQKQIAVKERKAWYYDWLLTAEEGAAELRLFGSARLFMGAYHEIRSKLQQDRLGLERHQLIGQLAAGLIGLLAAGICLAAMAWRVLQGAATPGDLVLFYQVLSQGQSIMRSQLQSAGQFYGSLLFLSNLFEFLDLQNTVVDPTEPVDLQSTGEPVTIRCENLTFSYPGSSNAVLKNFNLSLPAGQIIAIVGDNGAGKSTLLKLLCRLYDPQAGRITWNGIDLRDLAQQELRSRITVLFQEPMNYQASVRENIGYSDSGTLGQEEKGADRISHAACESGADPFIRKLPEGYETQLGKWFEHGTDLSVGQWQRIALARAFLRRSPLMLLDEPTSAMDAWSEADWLARLRQLCEGRTTLIITHRLTTAMQADVIHVMVDGQIIESGTHTQLTAMEGRYAQAWRSQTRALETAVFS